MTSDPESEREISFWQDLFYEVLGKLKTTHVSVYEYTLGRPSSPREIRQLKETLGDS